MANNKIEEIQNAYGLTTEEVRRAQASFASNLTGRYETTGSLNGEDVFLYFRVDSANTKGNIIHVYKDNQYTEPEWIATTKNLGFDDRCLDKEYIEDVVLNTKKEVMDARLRAMVENADKNQVITDKMKGYYGDLLRYAVEVSKTQASERE